MATAAAEVEYHDGKSGHDGEEEENGTGSGTVALERHINLVSIFNPGFTIQVCWEPIRCIYPLIFLNGGSATFVWGPIYVLVGAMAAAASLAEMASMDPYVGAQYRWSAGSARKWPYFWGLLQGWMTGFAWITGIAPNMIILAQAVQGLLHFYDKTYDAKIWHTTLLMLAFLAAALVLNLFFRPVVNSLETLGGIGHLLFWMVIIVVMTTLGKKIIHPTHLLRWLVALAAGKTLTFVGNCGIVAHPRTGELRRNHPYEYVFCTCLQLLLLPWVSRRNQKPA